MIMVETIHLFTTNLLIVNLILTLVYYSFKTVV